MRLGHVMAVLLLATACARPVDLDAAPNAKAHSTAVDRTPEIHRLEVKASHALLEEEDPGRALLLYRKAELIGPLSRDALVLGARAAARKGRPHKAVEWLELAEDAGFADAQALRGTEDLVSLRSDPAWPRILSWVDRNASGPPLPHGTGLVPATPEAEGIDPAALARLLKEAEEAHSSALVLLRHGKLVGEWYFGGKPHRIEAMSATKSVVSLAVGLLLDEGKLASLDEPVATFFPEWRQGPKSRITVRHLLNHTSGLFTHSTTEKIYASDDFVRYALDARLDAEPGTTFAYNNSATNLLAGVVTAAAGEPLDEYLRHRLFGPLGIEDVTWSRDNAGNRHGMSGMQIHPVDFAKIGQVMLDGGLWQGQRLVSEAWVQQSTHGPSQPLDPTCGLLWWLEAQEVDAVMDDAYLQTLRDAGVPPSIVDGLAKLPGHRLDLSSMREGGVPQLKPYQRQKLRELVRRRKVQPRMEIVGGYTGFSALGYLGQQLVVLPAQQLVAVRMTEYTDTVDDEVLSFSQFRQLVRTLVPSPPPPGGELTAPAPPNPSH
jgi:CubicO group peptidase (beta-lactamase class C family)